VGGGGGGGSIKHELAFALDVPTSVSTKSHAARNNNLSLFIMRFLSFLFKKRYSCEFEFVKI